MNSIFLLVLIQMINFYRLFGDIISDAKRLDKYIDLVEDNERRIHSGIASGRFEAEDRHESDDSDDDDYGKLLLQDMTNFQRVKIPGVDYEMDPVPIPVHIHPGNEVQEGAEEEEDDEEENSPPAPEEEPHERTVEPKENPPLDERLHSSHIEEPPIEPKRIKPDSIQEALADLPQTNPGYDDRNRQAQTEFETEPPLPIHSYPETLNYNKNIKPIDENEMTGFDDQIQPTPHISYPGPSDYQDNYPNSKDQISNPDLETGTQDPDKSLNNFNYNDNNKVKEQYDSYNEQNPKKNQFNYKQIEEPIDSQIPHQLDIDSNERNRQQSEDNSNNDQNIDNQKQSDYYSNIDSNNELPKLDDYHKSDFNDNSEPQRLHHLNADSDNNSNPSDSPNHNQQQNNYDSKYDPNYDLNYDPNYISNPSPQNYVNTYSNDIPPQRIEYNSNSNSEPNSESNSEPNSKPNSEPNGEPNSEPNGEPNSEPNGEPNRDLNIDTNSDSNTYPNTYPNSYSDSNPDMLSINHNREQNLKKENPNEVNPNEFHPTQPEIGSRGDQLLKYYEDHSRVDSQPLTSHAELVPENHKSIESLRSDDSNKYENKEIGNDQKVINKNIRIDKRIGLSSDEGLERRQDYDPSDYEPMSKRYRKNKPTGSREYQQKQEYHSFDPNYSSEPNSEELPSDEPKSYYDKWADEHIKLARDEYSNKNENRAQEPRPANEEPNPDGYELSRMRPEFENKQQNHNHFQPRPHDYSHSHSHSDSHSPEHRPQSEEIPIYPPNEPEFAQTDRPANEEQNNNQYEEPYTHSPNNEEIEVNNDNNNSNRDQPNGKSNEDFEYDIPQKTSFAPEITSGQFGTFSRLPFNFESLIASDPSFLDALSPNSTHPGTATTDQDYDNNNSEENTESENPNHFIGNDDLHESTTPSSDTQYEQQEFEAQREPHHTHHSHHSHHSQPSQPSEPSHPSQQYNNDQSSMEGYDDSNDDSHSDRYLDQNSDPNRHSIEDNQRQNDGYYRNQYNNNDKSDRNNRNSGQYSEQEKRKYEPRIHESRKGREEHFDEETAGTDIASTKKLNPKVEVLSSDESRKVFTQTNSTKSPNNNNNNNNKSNKSILIKSINSFKSWVKPLILKSTIMAIKDTNETNGTNVEKNLNNDLEKSNAKKEVETNFRSFKRKNKTNSENVIRKPKPIQQTNNNKKIQKQNIYDLVKNSNNSSEYHLKLSKNLSTNLTNPLHSSQHSVRTVRTRPQRSLSSKRISLLKNPNSYQLTQNSETNSQNILPNLSSSIRNRLLHTSEPKCIEKSLINDICFEFDDQYPLERLSRSLMKNIETLRLMYKRLNSSSENNYFNTLDSLDSTNLFGKSCRTNTIRIRPLRAKNINGQWKVIANIGSVFEQKISVSKCSGEHNQCETNAQKSNCTQEYGLNHLITYNIESNVFEIDMFSIPKACSCALN